MILLVTEFLRTTTVLLEEDRRTMLTVTTVDDWRADLIFAAHLLRRNPGFAVAAALTLALGIGCEGVISLRQNLSRIAAKLL